MIKLEGDTLRKQFVEYSEMVLDGGYFVPEKNKPIISDIFTTFETKPYGIVVYGQPGSGKTLIFDLLTRIIPPKHQLAFQKFNALDVVLNFNENGHSCFREYMKGDILFDDLGTEDKGIYYGDKVEVFEKLIQFRYDAFKSNGVRTFFTSNLTEVEIKKKYGQRCFSRLVEMCDRFILNDEDRRRLRNFKGFVQVNHEFKTKDDLEWEEHYAKHKENAKNMPKPKRVTLGDRFREQFGTDGIKVEGKINEEKSEGEQQPPTDQ